MGTMIPTEEIETLLKDLSEDLAEENKRPRIYLEVLDNIKALKRESEDYTKGWNDAIDAVLETLNKNIFN